MKHIKNLAAILFASFILSSCEVVGSIFKAGVWTGIIIVVVIIGLIIYLITKAAGKK